MIRYRDCLPIFVLILASTGVFAEDKSSPLQYDTQRIGDAVEGRIVVPTNQVLTPLGKQVAFSGRPTDVSLSPDGRSLAVLSQYEVLLINLEGPERGEIVARKSHRGGSYKGIVFTPDGRRLLASNIRGHISVFEVDDDGQLDEKPPIALPAVRASNALPQCVEFLRAFLADPSGHDPIYRDFRRRTWRLVRLAKQLRRRSPVGN